MTEPKKSKSSRIPLTWLLFALLLIWLVSSSGSGCSSDPSGPISETYATIMKRATNLTPYDQSDDGYIDFWARLAESGEAAMHHDAIKWSSLTGRSFQEDHLYNKEFGDAAQERNLEHILVLDVTDISRTQLTLPEGYEGYDFSDSTIREAYIDEVMWLANNASPDYFGLAVEINIYYNDNPQGFESWLEAYREAYNQLKIAHPNMTVFVYYQLEDLWGYVIGTSEPISSPKWFLLSEIVGYADLSVFSTYPGLVFQDPDSIPEDYYSEPAQQAGMPIAYAEFGYPSDDLCSICDSDPEEQRRFLEKFLEMNRPLEPEFMVWYFMYDMDVTGSLPGELGIFFSSHGLRWINQTGKPAWDVWRNFQAPR